MVTRAELQSMDPYDFESLVADVWEAKGFQTVVRSKSGDRGVDVVAEKPGAGWKEVIQVKRYADGNTIGSQKVREYATLYQQISDANTVVLVTSGDFTVEATRLAGDLRVETVDGNELVRQIERTGVSVATYLDTASGETNNEAGIREQAELISVHDSVTLDDGETVDPESYVRHVAAPGIRKPPWKYPVTAIDGVEFGLAACSDRKMNVVVGRDGVSYLDDEGLLRTVPLSTISKAEYEAYVMGLRKPTTVRFELVDGSEHVLTLRRGWKKRNVKHMTAFVAEET